MYAVFKNGFDFCGYKFQHGKVKVKSKIKRRFIKVCKSQSKYLIDYKLKQSICAYKGLFKHSNTLHLWYKYANN